jgi:hypothetical protein
MGVSVGDGLQPTVQGKACHAAALGQDATSLTQGL